MPGGIMTDVRQSVLKTYVFFWYSGGGKGTRFQTLEQSGDILPGKRVQGPKHVPKKTK